MSVTSQNATIALFKRAFQARGYAIAEFKLANSRYTRFTAPNGAQWLTRDARISYPMITATSSVIASKKHLAYELCSIEGINTPQTIKSNDLAHDRPVIEALMQEHVLVVKPNDASLSWGLTLNVRRPDQLLEAYQKARVYSDEVLLQQQVTGQEVRFIVADGIVRAALLRQTPQLVGDGSATIAELLEQENLDRGAIYDSMVSYPQLDDRIINFSNLDMTAIPERGEVIELSRAGMIKYGASIYNIINTLDSGYIAVAERAAVALASPFVAVDIMIEDLSQPATDKNYAFIEFNSAPVLALCYSVRDGNNYDAVADLVPLIERTLEKAAS
jgi:cyanophycin synthetase